MNTYRNVIVSGFSSKIEGWGKDNLSSAHITNSPAGDADSNIISGFSHFEFNAV